MNAIELLSNKNNLKTLKLESESYLDNAMCRQPNIN